MAKLINNRRIDVAVERAIAQGKTPSQYVTPGTELGIDAVTVKRLQQAAYKQVKAIRERVKQLGPRAGQLRLELLKAESEYNSLRLLAKQHAGLKT